MSSKVAGVAGSEWEELWYLGHTRSPSPGSVGQKRARLRYGGRGQRTELTIEAVVRIVTTKWQKKKVSGCESRNNNLNRDRVSKGR